MRNEIRRVAAGVSILGSIAILSAGPISATPTCAPVNLYLMGPCPSAYELIEECQAAADPECGVPLLYNCLPASPYPGWHTVECRWDEDN